YLVVKNGQPNNGIVELGPDGQPTGVVYNLSWINPAPDYPYSWAEGPVMWKYRGYYYYSFARDVSGGQKVMRSRTLTADQSAWEMHGNFFNEADPLKNTALFTSPNHSSPVVMAGDSTFWVIHPLYAKGEWIGQGRQGLLNQVHYDEDTIPMADYPVNRSFKAPALPCSGIPWMVPKSDFFTGGDLHPEWSFMGYTPDESYSLSERPGWLRLSPRSPRPNMVVKNDGEHNYSLITELDFDPVSSGDEAGLIIIRGDETMSVKLLSSVNSAGEKVIVFTYATIRYEVPNTVGNTIWLKMIRVNHTITGYFSSNGNEWTKIGTSMNISGIDSFNDFSTWAGTRQGLFVNNRKAWFNLYIYRDAYSSILASAPANQYGTVQVNSTVLDSIHDLDWALYAGVEFGNTEYGKTADSIVLTASSVTGGSVEVWLDSIGTGTLAGTCGLAATGSWNTFKTFSAGIGPVTGRHDLYLRFRGGQGKILQLKWIQFRGRVAPHYRSSGTLSDSLVILQLDREINPPADPSGFTVLLNGTNTDTIVGASLDPADESRIILHAKKKFTWTDRLILSYEGGNITSTDGMLLPDFSGRSVINHMTDPTPRALGAETDPEGLTILLHLNKSMLPPDDYPGSFSLERNSGEQIPVTSVTMLSGDTAVFVIRPGSRLYFEDTLSLSYAGTEIHSIYGFSLEPFSQLPVTVNAPGYPPLVAEATVTQTDSTWNGIALKFDRSLADISGQDVFFTVEVNGENHAITGIGGNKDSIGIIISPEIRYADLVSISYSGGTVSSENGGLLEDFTGFPVQNPVPFVASSIAGETFEGFSAYPVPGSGPLHIRSSSPFSAVEIRNPEGLLVYRREWPGTTGEAQVELEGLRGVYFLILKNGTASGIKKIIAE
ncbi:MAG: carbohydrate-binding protein, partial [Bacteroidota bacterium]